MKALRQPSFILQDILSEAIREAAGSCPNSIGLTDDFIAPQCLAGSSQPLANLFRLLLPNLLASGDNVQVKVRPLLQTATDLLLEFSVAHRKQPGAPVCKEGSATAPAFIAEAETAIKELGGRSERIQLSDAGGGLKFILKWCWLQQDSRLAPGSERAFSGRKVLIAEDNEVNAKGLLDLLSTFGIEGDIAVDGKGASDLLARKGGYDLVLMDLDMPHMDGFETARFLRKKLRRDTPIIGLSAASFSKEEVSFERSGLNYCIPKSSACQALPALLSRFFGTVTEVVAAEKFQHPLTQWGEHGPREAYKHTPFIHQHGPAF